MSLVSGRRRLAVGATAREYLTLNVTLESMLVVLWACRPATTTPKGPPVWRPLSLLLSCTFGRLCRKFTMTGRFVCSSYVAPSRLVCLRVGQSHLVWPVEMQNHCHHSSLLIEPPSVPSPFKCVCLSVLMANR